MPLGNAMLFFDLSHCCLITLPTLNGRCSNKHVRGIGAVGILQNTIVYHLQLVEISSMANACLELISSAEWMLWHCFWSNVKSMPCWWPLENPHLIPGPSSRHTLHSWSPRPGRKMGLYLCPGPCICITVPSFPSIQRGFVSKTWHWWDPHCSAQSGLEFNFWAFGVEFLL